jgi:predicted porin
MLRVGHINTPMKTLSRRVELFANQLGDSRNVMPGNFDERFDNSIFYTSPSFAGITANMQYSVETGVRPTSNNTAVDGNKNDAWSVSLTYQQGPIYAAVAHEQWNSETANNSRNATRLAAYYDIANIRITGLVHIASFDNASDANTYGLGLRYGLTPQIALKAQYYMLDSDAADSDADLIAVGVDYQYTKALRFYLNYAQVANAAGRSLAPWRSASTLGSTGSAAVGAADETARGIALGAIFNF